MTLDKIYISVRIIMFGEKCFGPIQYRTRVNRSQNWYDNGPDPCEQSTFPFQKSDRYDNGTISFPCERSLSLPKDPIV